jgi:hypothetical protein
MSRPRLCALLDHLPEIKQVRQAWKPCISLREALFLALCAKIASSDDCIVDSADRTSAVLSNSTSAFRPPIGCAAS